METDGAAPTFTPQELQTLSILAGLQLYSTSTNVASQEEIEAAIAADNLQENENDDIVSGSRDRGKSRKLARALENLQR